MAGNKFLVSIKSKSQQSNSSMHSIFLLASKDLTFFFPVSYLKICIICNFLFLGMFLVWVLLL